MADDFIPFAQHMPMERPAMHVDPETGICVFDISFPAQHPDLTITYFGSCCPDEEYALAKAGKRTYEEEYRAHNCFFMVFVSKGEYVEIVENQPTVVTDRDLLLLTPYSRHHGLHAEGTNAFFINISPALPYAVLGPILKENILLSGFFEEFLQDAKAKKALLFRDCMEKIRPLMYRLFEEYTQSPLLHKAMVRNLFSEIMIELARSQVTMRKDRHESSKGSMEEILDYLTLHFRTADLSQTAEHFHYHPAYLSARIRKQTGRSFKELITDYRLNQALLLLQDPEVTVEQAAFECGYRELSTFYKAFRRKFGRAPRKESI